MSKMFNRDIRGMAAASGVYLYEIAEALGIAEGSLSRKLRRELPEDEKQRIFGVIQSLTQGVS